MQWKHNTTARMYAHMYRNNWHYFYRPTIQNWFNSNPTLVAIKERGRDALQAARQAACDHRLTVLSSVLVAVLIGISSGGSASYASNYVYIPGQSITAPDASLISGRDLITTVEATPLDIAERYIGVPYVYGGASPSGFDCSGLTMYVYSQLGVKLPHSAGAQLSLGERVSESQAKPGDLIWMEGHAAFWVSPGMMLDAPQAGEVVGVRPIWASSYIIFRVK